MEASSHQDRGWELSVDFNLEHGFPPTFRLIGEGIQPKLFVY